MKVLAIDIDNTLTLDTAWTPKDCLKAKPNQEVIDVVNRLYKTNCIIIYTARGEEMRNATEYWLKKHKVRYHAIRMDKMPCDLLLDDKGVNNIYEFTHLLAIKETKEKGGLNE
jgi:uncharacterized HAD superfamily protein